MFYIILNIIMYFNYIVKLYYYKIIKYFIKFQQFFHQYNLYNIYKLINYINYKFNSLVLNYSHYNQIYYH